MLRLGQQGIPVRQIDTQRVYALLKTALSVSLTLLPLSYLVYLVATYRVDIPFWDQWDGLVPILDKYYQGTLSVQDLWMQHNEHRLIFPRLVMVWLARVSGWDITYELVFSLMLAVVLLITIVHQLRDTEKALHVRLVWSMPILAILVFSLSQAENWLWGFELQVFMNVLAVVLGIVLLHNARSLWQFAAALLVGIVATYSFANGLAYWAIGFFVLALLNTDGKRTKTFRLVMWILVAGLTIGSYLYDYHAPSHHPSLWSALTQPLQYAEYVLVYLGMPLTVNSVGCVLNGVSCERVEIIASLTSLLGLAVFAFLIWSLARRVGLNAFAPYVAIGVYAILSAIGTGIGRAGFGVTQGMASRYITISSLLWISIIVMVFIWISGSRLGDKKVLAGYALIAVLTLLVLANSIQWKAYFVWRYEFLSPARTELFALQNDELLKHLYPSPDYVRTQTRVLQKYHLSVFRGP